MLFTSTKVRGEGLGENDMSRKEFLVKRSRPVADIAGGIAMVTTIVLAGHTSAAPSDQQAIQQVVHDSQVAEQKLCVLPSGFARVIQHLPPQAVRAITDHVASDLAQYYTGQLLGEQTTLLQHNCAAAVTGGQSVEIGGGLMIKDAVASLGAGGTCPGRMAPSAPSDPIDLSDLPVTADGVVKVTDFGIASGMISSSTTQSQALPSGQG